MWPNLIDPRLPSRARAVRSGQQLASWAVWDRVHGHLPGAAQYRLNRQQSEGNEASDGPVIECTRPAVGGRQESKQGAVRGLPVGGASLNVVLVPTPPPCSVQHSPARLDD